VTGTDVDEAFPPITGINYDPPVISAEQVPA